MEYANLPAAGGETSVDQTAAEEAIDRQETPPQWDLRLAPSFPLKALAAEHTLLDAITSLIGAAAEGTLQRVFERAPREWAQIQERPYYIGGFLDITLAGPIPFAHINVSAPWFAEMQTYTALKSGAYYRSNADIDLRYEQKFTWRTIVDLGEMLRR